MDTGQFRLSIFIQQRSDKLFSDKKICKFSLIVNKAYPSLTSCPELQEQANTSHTDARETKHFTSGVSATNNVWQFHSFSHVTSEKFWS